MSKDIEETWVNIPANPAAKSAQSNKADTNDIDDLITAFIMQYDQRVKISNKRNVEAVERHKAAIQKWAAQETNKARLSELEMFKKIEVMDISPAVAAHISRRYKALTADKEQTP